MSLRKKDSAVLLTDVIACYLKIGYIEPYNFKTLSIYFIYEQDSLPGSYMHFMCVFRVLFVLFLPFLSLLLLPLLDAFLHPTVLGIDPQPWAWLHGWALPPDSWTRFPPDQHHFSNSLKLQPLSRIITFWHDNIPKSLFLLCLILETTPIYRHRNGHADTQIVSASSYWT